MIQRGTAPGSVLATCILGTLCIAAPSPTETAAAAETVEFTIDQGTNMALALSPDGKSLVVDVQGTLWLLESGSKKGRALTDGLGDDRQPSFSPDGRRIAFQSYRSGLWHVWSVGVDGSGLRQITTGDFDDREPAWSPDGARIAFSSDREGNYDVWSIDLESGSLSRHTSDEGNDYAPAWSPDGRHLVFVSDRSPKRGLYVADVPGNASAPALVHASPDVLAGPTFSPGSERLIFQSYAQAEGSTALQLLNLGSRQVRTLSSVGDDVFPFRAAWSSEKQFFYTANGNILHADLEGQATIRAFELPIRFERTPYERRNRFREAAGEHAVLGIVAPDASPDGERVAFTALGDLWMREADGSLTRLTDSPAVEAYPRFSPDGDWLVYVSDQGGAMDVWLLELSSAKSRPLTALEGAEAFPVFSPDGSRVAFFAEEVGRFLQSRVRTVEVASGEISASLSNPMPPVQIDWTPEGTHLIGRILDRNSSRFREGAFRLQRLSLADGSTTLFSPLAEQSLAHARYSPDGGHLAWVADGRLWVADRQADGTLGEGRALTEGLADWPAWSGDSKRLIFLAGDRLRRVELGGSPPEDLAVDLEWHTPPPPAAAVVHAGRLFDGRSPEYRRNVDVLIEGGRIRGVVPHSEAAHRGVEVIDATGKTVIPGLFEMHAHQSINAGEALGRRWLAFGVTSVREPGTDPYDGVERRESWASGRRIGPREFLSGWLLDGSRVYYSVAEGTASRGHVERAVERARLLRYDLIKTYVRLSDSDQKRVVELAHELGIPTSSHEIYPAASSGMDAVEHLSATSRRGYSPKMSLLGRVYDDVIDIVAGSRLNMTPTLVLPCLWPYLFEHPEILDDAVVDAFLSEGEQRFHLSRGRSMASPRMKARCAEQKAVAKIVAAGGRITAGTDSPIVPYGLALHIELRLLVAAGLTPFEALRSATLWAAEAVGVEDDLGTIEVGKLADLLVIDGDPLSDIGDSLHVVTTLKGGRVYPRAVLLEAASP